MQLLKNYKSEKYPTKWESVTRDSQNIMEPVIRAVDSTSGMKCQLSFSSKHFVETGKRLKMFIETVPMSKSHPPHIVGQTNNNSIESQSFSVQIMVDCLKNWQMYSSGFEFNTYQLTILVIWYFQYREYLASVRIYENVNYFKGEFTK